MPSIDKLVDRRAEAALGYTVDPARNYWLEIDRDCPPWQPGGYQRSELQPGAALDDNSKQREAISATGQVYQLPHYRYVRALNPQGEFQALIVSTARPSPEHPDGDDGISSATRIMGEKVRRGWLIVERGPEAETWMQAGGRVGDEYLAWIYAVRDHRRRLHLQEEQRGKAEYELQAVRLQRQAAEDNRTLLASMGAVVGEQVARVMRDHAQAPAVTATPAPAAAAKGR